MSAHHTNRVLVVATMLVLLSGPVNVPSAYAGRCPDVEVVFARGMAWDLVSAK